MQCFLFGGKLDKKIEKKFKAALESYAKLELDEVPVMLFDSTLFGSATDGFILTTPFTIGGSIFLLLANLPIPGYIEFMTGIFGDTWLRSLNSVANATFSILALIVLMAVTQIFTAREGCDANMATLLAVSTFLILIPPDFTTQGGETLYNIIPKEWTGSNGIITASIVALFTSYVFCYCIKNRWVIPLPSSIPRNILRAFDGIIPAVILFTVASVISGICHAFGATTLPELIFIMIQMPLQGLSDSIFGATVIVSLQSILFWFGIHGPNLTNGVVAPLVLANALDNQAMIDAGISLIGNPDAKIFTAQINDVFIKGGGTGATLGLLIASFLVSKSRQMKSITKIAVLPGIFNINEPLIFGIPIMFNPYLLVPFIIAPLVCLFITWFAISIGFMSPLGAIQAPWTMPTILSGFILDGWHGAAVQFVNLLATILIYFPFLKIQDREYLEEENEETEDLEDDSLV